MFVIPNTKGSVRFRPPISKPLREGNRSIVLVRSSRLASRSNHSEKLHRGLGKMDTIPGPVEGFEQAHGKHGIALRPDSTPGPGLQVGKGISITATLISTTALTSWRRFHPHVPPPMRLLAFRAARCLRTWWSRLIPVAAFSPILTLTFSRASALPTDWETRRLCELPMAGSMTTGRV